MKRIGFIGLASLLIFIIIFPSIVLAETISGTETIDEDEFWHIEIPLLDRSEIYITIGVLNGIPVDIFLFDEEIFEQYRNQESSYELLFPSIHIN